VVEESCVSPDWPNRRTAPKTIHPTGDSTEPKGPPISPAKLVDALETADTIDTAAADRTAAGAGSTTNGATTALGRAALIDAVAGGADTGEAGGAVTDRRVGSSEAGLALSLCDAAAVDGLTFFTGTVDDECPEPDGFFSDVVVDTPALATSAPVP